MYYAITHLTKYQYSEPITDSVMEVRKQPRSDGLQRSVRFSLEISPEAKVLSHRDYLGNTIHTFDIPSPHERLAIRSEAIAEVRSAPPLPDRLPESAWDEIEAQYSDRDYYDMLLPGRYTKETDLLKQFAQEIGWKRAGDPLTLLHNLNTTIYNSFEYRQHVTRVDSPIDIALEARRGVCQDFAHIMITLCRNIGIPSRYVSGYLFHREDVGDRSDVDASHAWVEAWLPDLGWVGFDPTNNLVVADRHVRVSIGRDYAEAAPVRGVFKGDAQTKLEVRVHVYQLDELPVDDTELTQEIVMPHYEYYHKTQQQQQQQ